MQNSKKEKYLKWSKICRIGSSICFIILVGIYIILGIRKVDIEIFAFIVASYVIAQMEIIKLIDKNTNASP